MATTRDEDRIIIFRWTPGHICVVGNETVDGGRQGRGQGTDQPAAPEQIGTSQAAQDQDPVGDDTTSGGVDPYHQETQVEIGQKFQAQRIQEDTSDAAPTTCVPLGYSSEQDTYP